ncbi:putative transcription regulator mTERF family [Medicago truncatula]|uniref:Putative transcription regulator mTERF family n=1 Tax=Medicago truncatula TaxID=3880 RepID=A0A072V7I7_MEDTR|nr:uncharacterized protein LOC25488171 [Medicago truncatula]KEH37303.1 mTERF protein [Medicago truncatula]RHN73235.1 putative transcription regulator mTERF family [Medicago truncatula]
MFKTFLNRNAFAISKTSTALQYSLRFLTTAITSDSNSFAVSYLIHKFGFTPESALKASKQLYFKTSQKPDSVINFFKNHGFNDSDIQNIIKREPWLLSCDTHKRILPKFQFLLSKGASTSDILRIVVGNPRFMKSSLKNRVIPNYNLITQFLKSNQKAMSSVILCPSLICCNYMISNINLMIDNGVCNTSIYRILSTRPNAIFRVPRKVGETMNELKNMGFDPTRYNFGDALLARLCLSKSTWNDRIDTFKKWGWSEETVMEAIRKQPKCMLVSDEKINRVLSFWVNELGWDSSYLAKGPGMFCYCLEKRIIPRAMVVFYLLTKGLRSEFASLTGPFYASEKFFMERYVLFYEEDASHLLKLYHQMMKMADKKVQQNHKSWQIPFVKRLIVEK